MSAESNAPSDGPTQSQRRWIALGISAAVVLVLVVLIIVLQGGDDDDRPPSSSTTPTASNSAQPSPSPGATTTGPPATMPVPSGTPTLPNPIRAAFDDEIVLDNGVAIEVTDIESVDGKARGPGQVAGPALRFTIQVTNESKKALNLDLAIVTAYSGRKDDPAIDLAGPGAKALPQKLQVGATASGKYVFAIPENERGRVRVDFSYIIDQPKIIFRGPGN